MKEDFPKHYNLIPSSILDLFHAIVIRSQKQKAWHRDVYSFHMSLICYCCIRLCFSLWYDESGKIYYIWIIYICECIIEIVFWTNCNISYKMSEVNRSPVRHLSSHFCFSIRLADCESCNISRNFICFISSAVFAIIEVIALIYWLIQLRTRIYWIQSTKVRSEHRRNCAQTTYKSVINHPWEMADDIENNIVIYYYCLFTQTTGEAHCAL